MTNREGPGAQRRGAAAGEAHEPEIGSTIGGYILTGRTLGRGGFGVVYEGRHATLDRTVAIKVQAADCSAPDADARLIEEAKLVARMRHPNIVDLFDIGTLPDGRVYLIMELLEGVTLHAHLAEVGRMSIASAAPILAGIASALDAIHAKGFAHRDVKPSNVMLTRAHGGALQAKLLDFGIAKAFDPTLAQATLTTPGTMIGTPPYMAPEQCLGELIQPASDVYALGVVAFRMLTGALPFTGAPVDIYHAHVHAPPPAPSAKHAGLDPRLDAPLLAMLAKAPSDRPASAVAAIAALSLRGEYVDRPTQAGDPLEVSLEVSLGPPIDARPSARTRSRLWWLLPIAGAVLATAAAIVVLGRDEPPAPAATAGSAVSQPVAAQPAIVPDAGVVSQVPVDGASPTPAANPAHATKHPSGRGKSAGSAKPRRDDLEALPEAYRDHGP